MSDRKRLLIVGLARDCAPTLPGFFSFIEQVQATGLRVAALIGENGSQDATRAELEAAAAGGVPLEVMDTSFMAEVSDRLERMATARECQRLVACERFDDIADKALMDASQVGAQATSPDNDGASDFICVVDLDNVMAQPPSGTAIYSAIERLGKSNEHFAVSATSNPFYYDLLALRCAEYAREDLNERINDAKRNKLTYYFFMRQAVFNVQTQITRYGVSACRSAFNGLCVYRRSHYATHSYFNPAHDPAATCEHVVLNEAIHQTTGKHIFVDDQISIQAPAEHVPQNWFQFHLNRLPKLVK